MLLVPTVEVLATEGSVVVSIDLVVGREIQKGLVGVGILVVVVDLEMVEGVRELRVVEELERVAAGTAEAVVMMAVVRKVAVMMVVEQWLRVGVPLVVEITLVGVEIVLLVVGDGSEGGKGRVGGEGGIRGGRGVGAKGLFWGRVGRERPLATASK